MQRLPRSLRSFTKLPVIASAIAFSMGSATAATYEQDFDGFADGATNLGDGSIMAGSAQINGLQLRLTEDAGASGFASFSIPPLPGSSVGWTATFDLTITDSSGNDAPADGFSFNYGNAPMGTLGSAEEGMATIGGVTENLSFEVDTWMNFDAEQGVNIAEKAGGTDINLAFNNGPILNDGTSVSGLVTMSWNPVDGASFTTTGLLTNANFSNVATTFVPNDNHTFILSARVGGANQTVLIDNLTVITTGSTDNDNDGLPNDWEVANMLDPDSNVGDDGTNGDPDMDGLTNLEEFQKGTHPKDSDSDNDTLLDGVETCTGIWIGTGDTGTNPLNPDSDNDALGDGVENPDLPFVDANQPGTDPNIPDTDGDGVNDGQEITAGRDPTMAEPVGDILITEFMASNDSTLQDFESTYPDWIEIYNNGALSVNLLGWHLTDDVTALTKWTFPSVVLNPGEFLVVFASDKNLTTPELHTNFKLSSGGEYLALIEPDGVTVSHEYAPFYPPQLTDISYGLEMNASTTEFAVEGTEGKYFVPENGALGTSWTGTGFNDSGWATATNGIGFDTSGTLDSLITSDIEADMRGNNSGTYFRIPFTIADTPSFDSMLLDMKYDDGFVVYLNGTAICDSNAPASPVWNSVSLAENSGGLAVNDFLQSEVPFALVNHSSTAASIIGGADPFLRLTYNNTGGNRNSIHFDRTDIGPFSTLTAEFDFRMNSTADGFAFLMLPTSTYGVTSASAGVDITAAEEPNVAGILGIGFDIYNNIDETSIHFGSTRAQNDLSGSIDLNNDVWHRAHIEIQPSGAGGSDVSVSVTPDIRGAAGAPVVFHNNVNIPDLAPYEYRVEFIGRTGGQTTNIDIDSISVSQSGTSGGALSESKDVSQHIGLLQTGANVLSVHGLNFAVADPDFLALPELRAVKVESVNPASTFFYESPTPGAPNVLGTNGTAGPVTFSPGATTFNTSLNVTLTSNNVGGEIRYTTNSSNPTQSSTLYTGPINLTTSTQIRARAFVPNFSPGPAGTEAFFKLEADLQSFTSDLPMVVVDNFGAGGFPSPGGTFQPMMMAVFDRNPDTGRSSMTDAPQLVTRGGARRRGSSTGGQSKPNLRVETWGEVDQEDESVDLLDFPKESDFVLYAPYSFDRALMRNAFVYQVSNDMGRYAVRTRFVEVFLNTGGGNLSYASDYHGVYILMESIKRDNDRVDIAKLGPADNAAPEVTGGYLWKIDRGSPSFSAGGQGSQVLEDPDASEITGAQDSYIKGYINSFGAALNGGNFTDPALGYAPFIDGPAWIDHHLINILTYNVDAFRLSTFLHKDREKPIVAGPAWDFDRSLESYDSRDDNPQTWSSGGGTDFWQYGWWNRLFDDPNFSQMWIDRWCELRKPGGEFTDAYLFGILDSMQAEITEAAPRNYARWTSVPPNNGGSLAGEVQNIKDWLATRTAWFDSQLAGKSFFSRNGGVVPSGTQVTLTPPAGGVTYYTLDGSDPRGDGGTFAGTLYSGPITLTQSAHIVTRVFKSGNPTNLFDSRWGCQVDNVFLIDAINADASNLVITELHFHPAPATASEITAGFPNDDDFEFVELLNTSGLPIDLVNCRFDDGIEFTFPVNTIVPADERLILARNPAAFTERYGAGFNLMGGYAPTNLSNDGEHLRLLDWDGAVISEFTFNDIWYAPTDGNGYSLELRDPATSQALLNDKASWGISCDFHGTPGYASTSFGQAFSVWGETFFTPAELGDSGISGSLVDLEGDGWNNLLEYAFNMDPELESSSDAPFATVAGGKLAITFTRWKKAVDLTYTVEISDDVATWIAVTDVATTVDNGDGTETVTITDSELLNDELRRFIRINVGQN